MTRESARQTWAEAVFLGQASVIALLFAALYAIAIIFLIGALTSHPLLDVPTLDPIEALLALGTLTLAYATVVQALFAARQHKMAVSPRLDIQFSRRQVSASTGEVTWEPIVTSPFFIEVSQYSDDKFRFVVRNFGPGAAVGIRVVGHLWPKSKETSNILQPTGPDRSKADEFYPYAESLSLKSGDEQEFVLDLVRATHQTVHSGALPYSIRRQIVLTAEGTDVEGRPAKAPPAGLLHTQTVLGPPEVPPPRASTTWVLLAGQHASELVSPVPPGIGEDFAAHLPQAPPT